MIKETFMNQKNDVRLNSSLILPAKSPKEPEVKQVRFYKVIQPELSANNNSRNSELSKNKSQKNDSKSRNRLDPEADKYEIIRDQQEDIRYDNEIFVSSKGSKKFFLKQALLLFRKNGKRTLVIKASGSAISKAVSVAEDIKRHQYGLHQLNSFYIRKIQHHYIAKEEGLDDKIVEKEIDGLEIILSKDVQDTTAPGYQAPIPANQIQHLSIEEIENLA